MGWDKVTEEADLGHNPWTVGQILQHECKIEVVEVDIDFAEVKSEMSLKSGRRETL